MKKKFKALKETLKRMSYIFLDHILVGGGIAVGVVAIYTLANYLNIW